MTPESPDTFAALAAASGRDVGVRRIAVRTTLRILLFGCVVGAAVALASAVLIENWERDRLERAIDEVMETVERTASVAAYARDEQLAAEVVGGLLHNRSIAYAVIEDGNAALAAAGQVPAEEELAAKVLARPLLSPFTDEVVGTLRVQPADELIIEQATDYSRLIAIMMGILVLSIAAGVAVLVGRGVTRGIRELADGLHRVDISTRSEVLVPVGHADDELGRLASDINILLARVDAALTSERATQVLHAAAERKWRLIFENAESGLFTLDAEGYLREWNPALKEVLGLPPEMETGQRIRLADCLVDGEGGMVRMLQVIGEGREFAERDFQCVQTDGEVRWLHVVLNPLAGPEGMLQGLANDVTGRKHAEMEARTQAARDALTGLLNRRGVEDVYALIVGSEPAEAGVGVLLIDLDGFKAVNDTYGHEAGDDLLRQVARRIESVVRQSDKVGRIGGDEFIILLPTMHSEAVASRVAGKVVESLGLPFSVLDGVCVSIGASVGVVCTITPPRQIAELLRRGDAAMYEAKKSGKSQYRIAPPG